MTTLKALGALFIGTALLTGCMSEKPSQSNYSGWLDDYSNLTAFKTATGGTSMRWVNPALKEGQYRAILIEPVTYFPAPKTNDQVSRKTLDAIPDYLVQQVRKNLGHDGIAVVQKPGPGVLRIRAAITAVETPTEGLQAYEVIPIALVFAGVSTAAGTRDHNTLVYLEAQLTDSQTNAVMAKVVRKGIGENLENDKAQMTLNDAKPALDDWAKDAATFAKAFIK